jgi:hypothetical protein
VRILAALVVPLALATTASSPVVRANGRIGPFRIDVTTERQLRASLGKPDRVLREVVPPQKTLGRHLYYRCGRGCRTVYSFSNATGKLSDFQTTSPGFVTAHGSRVGMRGAEAARREGTRLVPGCGSGLYLHLRWDAHHTFVLTVWHGKVDGIVYLGPHSIYYDGLC